MATPSPAPPKKKTWPAGPTKRSAETFSRKMSPRSVGATAMIDSMGVPISSSSEQTPNLVLQYLAAGIARQWLCLDDDANGTFERRPMFARPLHQFFLARPTTSPHRHGSSGLPPQRELPQTPD